MLQHDGRIVKRLGDGLMATFLAPRPAVDAALEAQEAVAAIDVGGYRPQHAGRDPLGLAPPAGRRLPRR